MNLLEFLNFDKRKKIAFLFLIYDEIENEELWHNFFRKIDKSRYSICIHWKYDKQLEYFDHFKLKNPVPTKYAEMSLVKAENLLLREALKDSKNRKFIFLSNSCIPLKPFDFIYNSLFNNDYCYFNLAREEHIFEKNRGILVKEFGRANVRKASQWSILTLPIARILSESDSVLESIFEPGLRSIADEYFYISYLHYLKKQHHLKLSQYSVTGGTTFEFWDDREYEFTFDFTSTQPEWWIRRLKTYFNISRQEINYLFNAPCYFGRKFAPVCTVDEKESLTDYITHYYNF